MRFVVQAFRADKNIILQIQGENRGRKNFQILGKLMATGQRLAADYRAGKFAQLFEIRQSIVYPESNPRVCMVKCLDNVQIGSTSADGVEISDIQCLEWVKIEQRGQYSLWLA